MKTYELTYIIPSGVTSQEANNVAKEVESFIQNKEGVILKSEKTTPQTLAYVIKKQSSGYFNILEFKVSEDKIGEVKERLEKDGKILRHLITLKKPVRELKEKRVRKPFFTKERVQDLSFYQNLSFAKTEDNKSKKESVEMEDIDKKLDEILNE